MVDTAISVLSSVWRLVRFAWERLGSAPDPALSERRREFTMLGGLLSFKESCRYHRPE